MTERFEADETPRADGDRAAGDSADERRAALKNAHTERMMRNDAAAVMLGLRVVSDEPGRAVVEMPVRDDMMNGFATTHGGIVFALADTAFAICCNEDDRVTVASGADISFLRPTRAGQTLTATAVRRARTTRTGLYDVTVTDELGRTIAEFRGRSTATDRPFD